MNKYLAVLIGGLSALLATASCAKSAESEILVASSAILRPEWTELRPKTAMQTTGDWSELFIEIPDLHTQRAGGPLLGENEKEILVEGYLIANNGERIQFDEVEIVTFGVKNVLRLSNQKLEWKDRGYRFKSVLLKTNRQINVGKIVWFSYDPRSTHTGVAIPKSFQ